MPGSVFSELEMIAIMRYGKTNYPFVRKEIVIVAGILCVDFPVLELFRSDANTFC